MEIRAGADTVYARLAVFCSHTAKVKGQNAFPVVTVSLLMMIFFQSEVSQLFYHLSFLLMNASYFALG